MTLPATLFCEVTSLLHAAAPQVWGSATRFAKLKLGTTLAALLPTTRCRRSHMDALLRAPESRCPVNRRTLELVACAQPIE
eukprot:6590088-Prymnesium_polylepis.1